MTSISDYSDTAKYTIKKVGFQTGIRPITLRAWERRYGILSPYRSDNRYRLYSDRDVAILNWLKSRVSTGISISTAVSELRRMTDQGIWPEAVATGLPAPLGQPEIPPVDYSRQLYTLLIQHDETSAGDLLREVFSTFDLMTIMSEIITPCLVELGMAWYRGEIRITTEHFASSFLRGKLLSLLQAYPVRRGAASVMLGGAPTEQHEIGALIMAVLLRSEGYQVEFLGPDVPLNDLVDYARFEKPAMIVLTATTRPAALELKHMQEKVNRIRPTPIFAYGGSAFNNEPALRKDIPGVFLGETLNIALGAIETVLASQKNIQPLRLQTA